MYESQTTNYEIMRDYSETIPVQYEEGKTDFMGLEIMVDPRVLIPRPETELLVKKTAELISSCDQASPRILDLCTGSGVIAIALAKLLQGASITAVDVSEDAVCVAKENVRKHGLEERIDLKLSDLFECFDRAIYKGSFDCIVSNPPYVSDRDYKDLDVWVKAEPKIALHAGEKGMDYLGAIIGQSLNFLRPGGFLALEAGYDQALQVRQLLSEAGFKGIRGYLDSNGYERVITGSKDG